MNKKISSKLVSLIFTILVICFVVGFYVFAYTEPTANPPVGNVFVPLNVSSSPQVKVGGLVLNTGGATYGLAVDQGNVGIGTTTPSTKLQVAEGDVYISTAGNGLILKSPNGLTCKRVGIDDAGNLVTAAIACP